MADHPPGDAVRAFLPATLRLAVATGLGLCLLAVPLSAVLHLTSPVHVLLTAAILAPFAVTCAVEGALQGTQRYFALSVVFAVTGVARFAGGVGGLAAGHSATAVLAGTAVGGLVSAAVCAVVVARSGTTAPPGLLTHLPAELGHVMVAVGGLLALTNLDLLLARVVLSAHDAGLYAAGSLATKAVYWAPQFVAVSVFPRLTDPTARRRLLPRAMLVVGAIGAVATVVAAACRRDAAAGCSSGRRTTSSATGSGCSACSVACWRWCSCSSRRGSPRATVAWRCWCGAPASSRWCSSPWVCTGR